MIQSVPLSRLTREIVKCWISAENELRADISQRYWNPAEEDVTFLFCGLLRNAVAEANEHRRFEHAFASDLGWSFPDLVSDAWGISAGLAGSVSFHGRQYEGRTSAADIGLLLVRPSVRQSPWSQDSISIAVDDRRALLAQAKIGRARRDRLDWGTLTERQRDLFPRHAAYMALLLYGLGGPKGEWLSPFSWQLCDGATVQDIESWLGRDSFPSKQDSESIIEGLAQGRIGSDDPGVCKLVIDPGSVDTRCIEIRVSWPEDVPPEGGVLRRRLHSKAQNTVPLLKLRG